MHKLTSFAVAGAVVFLLYAFAHISIVLHVLNKYAPIHPDFRPAPDTVQIGGSVILLVASLYIILSKRYPASDRHWAYGIVGTLLGFWLKP